MSNPTCPIDRSVYGGTLGSLPPCGDFASPYVPALSPFPERYSYTDALNNGTLFPALNLPFHLMVNGKNVVNNALNELQALSVVVLELGLYLDTHPDDAEALHVYREYVAREKAEREKYSKNTATLTQTNSANAQRYTWVDDPWPWEISE